MVFEEIRNFKYIWVLNPAMVWVGLKMNIIYINTFLFEKKISFDIGRHDLFHVLVLVPAKESSKKRALDTGKNQIFLCLSSNVFKILLAAKAARQDPPYFKCCSDIPQQPGVQLVFSLFIENVGIL